MASDLKLMIHAMPKDSLADQDSPNAPVFASPPTSPPPSARQHPYTPSRPPARPRAGARVGTAAEGGAQPKGARGELTTQRVLRNRTVDIDVPESTRQQHGHDATEWHDSANRIDEQAPEQQHEEAQEDGGSLRLTSCAISPWHGGHC